MLYKDAHDRTHNGKNHAGNLYDDTQDFREVALGRGTFSLLRRGRDDEGGGVVYGVSDEESRLNVNTATSEELTKIQGLDSDIARAILSWRGQGTNVMETEYYLAQRPPYQPRGGPYETVRELLMVRDVTPDLLLGRDAHQNGLLDDEAVEAKDPPKFEDSVSAADLGWANLLTVDSGVKNVNAAGDSRVNIQNADESALTGVHGITRDIAHAIVSYRSKNNFQSIVDLLDVTPAQDNQNGQNGGAPPNGQDSSGSTGGGGVIDQSLLMQIADDVTTADDKNLNGVVNINTASLDVLVCLPGIDRDLAQKIISYRQSSGFFANPAELMKVDGITPDLLKQIVPLVTARSETYRILAEGRVKSTGVRQRIQVIVRVNLDGVKTLSYREDDL